MRGGAGGRGETVTILGEREGGVGVEEVFRRKDSLVVSDGWWLGVEQGRVDRTCPEWDDSDDPVPRQCLSCVLYARR